MSTPKFSQQFANRRALVGFSAHINVWWLKFLKPGFAHCAVAIEDGEGGFVFYNPLLRATELCRIPGDARAVSRKMQEGGFKVVATRTQKMPKNKVAYRPYNCVEGVKRALGISAPLVLTPWQLYMHIKKNHQI